MIEVKGNVFKVHARTVSANCKVEFGIQAAVCRFSKDFGVDLNESTIRSWKAKYLAEVDAKKSNGEGDAAVTCR